MIVLHSRQGMLSDISLILMTSYFDIS